MKPCPETFPYPLIVLDETDSTNRYISQLCNNPQKAVAELTTVSAEFQTAGKGQRGNSWEAEKEKNLLFSFVLYPTFLEARCQFILSQIISLSIKEELDRWSDEITIKWPNDIYWRDKKICGILIENDLSGHFIGRCISGVGININQKEFHSDAPNPVSLKQITGKEHNRHEILAHILKRVQIYYNGLQTEERNTYAAEISARYARALFRRRGFHLYEDANGKFSARLRQIGVFVAGQDGGVAHGVKAHLEIRPLVHQRIEDIARRAVGVLAIDRGALHRVVDQQARIVARDRQVIPAGKRMVEPVFFRIGVHPLRPARAGIARAVTSSCGRK